MKLTMDLDFTPLEARQFLGLPDVQALQAAVLAKMEERLMANIESFSPEGLLNTWFTGGAQSAEKSFRGLASAFFAQGIKEKPTGTP